MYCKIIAFDRFHLYFAILYFCLQNFIFFCNTLILLQIYTALFRLRHCYNPTWIRTTGKVSRVKDPLDYI